MEVTLSSPSTPLSNRLIAVEKTMPQPVLAGNPVLKSDETDRTRAQLSMLENVLVGGGGGMLETSIQMPLITAKYCTQEGRAFPSSVRGWWRGVATQAGAVAPLTGLQAGVNGLLISLVTGGERDITAREQFATAFAAGIMSATIYGPMDVMVIQQQKLKMGFTETARYLSATYGPTFFTRGFVATAGRESLYTAGGLALTPVLRDWTSANTSLGPFFSTLLGGMTAGLLAASLSHPIDTAKTVIQADIARAEYQTARDAMRVYYKFEGVRGLYRGFALRAFRLGGAFIVISTI